MASRTTPKQDTPKQDVNPYADLIKESATSGETIRDHKTVTEVLTSITSAVKGSLTAARTATTRNKALAIARLRLALEVTMANGLPDWSRNSGLYKALLARAEDGVWVGASGEEKRRVDGAVRQLISRKFLECFITKHALENLSPALTDEENKGLKWQAVEDDYAILVGEIPARVKSAIADEYLKSGITLPTKFGGKASGSGNGGASGPKADSSVVADLAGAVLHAGEQGHLSFLALQEALWKAQTALAEKIRGAKDGEVPDRPKVEAAMRNTGTVALVTAKYLHGSQTEQEKSAYDSARYLATEAK